MTDIEKIILAELKEVKSELKEVRKEMGTLKIKVASISTLIGIAITYIKHKFIG